MEEKLNELLVQEIKNNINSAEETKKQLLEELNKYEGREASNEKLELLKDIDSIDRELTGLNSDMVDFTELKKQIEDLEAESTQQQIEYEKLLQKKDEYVAAINKLNGRFEIENGKFVPTKEQQEYEADLDKINQEINKFDELKTKQDQLKAKRNELENLYTRYKINEKYNQITKEEDEMWEAYNESKKIDPEQVDMEIEKAYQEKEKSEQEQKDEEKLQTKKEVEDFYAHLEETEPQKPQFSEQGNTDPKNTQSVGKTVTKIEPTRQQVTKPQPIRTDKKIVGISCEIKNGNAIYSIISDGMEPIEVKADPYKMTKNNKLDLRKDIDPYYFSNIDIGIVRILKKIDYQHGTKFYAQYLDNVKYMEDEEKSNIPIKYDLTNLRNTDLNLIQKMQLKRAGKANQFADNVEYIKPKGIIQSFIERFKQRKLTAGTKKLNADNKNYEQQPKDSPKREEFIFNAYNELSNEPGFDFDVFSKQFNLSPRELEIIESHPKFDATAKKFRENMRQTNYNNNIALFNRNNNNDTKDKEEANNKDEEISK